MDHLQNKYETTIIVKEEKNEKNEKNIQQTEQKCTICYETIQTKDYIGKQDFDCVDIDDTSCLRIKCGHAFHINCIMQAFRGNLKCPICREDLVTTSVQNSDFYIHVLDIENEGDENEEMDEAYHPDRLRLETEIKLERCKNKIVNEKRKILKKKVKDFHLFHASLKKTRKDEIRNIMQTFRKKNHKQFIKHIKIVQTEINEILNIEKNIVEEKLKDQNVELNSHILQNFFYKTNPIYNVFDILQKNGEDVNINGFQKKFWTG
jgi:hypothetical protein